MLWLLLTLAASLLVDARAEAQALASTVQVAMPDGVTLATDVWRPVLDNTPRPVLLRRTPYGRAMDFNLAQTLVGQGFVLVSQDVRGRGGSNGTFEPFFDDKVDGKATIEWAAKQPWSNGAVATYSNSAEGIVQYMALASAPRGLRCAHLGMPTHDLYESLFPGGAWRTELGTRWLSDLGAASVVELWKSHEARDAYWADATLSTAEMASITQPLFIMGGFFDIFAPSQVRAFRELRANVAPAARDDVFLMLGPWTHGGIGLRGQGDLLYPEHAPYTAWSSEMMAYLKWCAMDGPRPAFAQARYYLTEITDQSAVDPADNVTRTVARGEWRSGSSWPPASKAQRLLVRDLKANTPASIAIAADAVVPSNGGGNLSTPAGPFEQSTIDARPDVLTFTSQPVTADIELVGLPVVKLWVSSATSDLDVIVRLELVTAQGKAFALTDGIRRGRFVQGYDAVRPLTAGRPTLFEIELGPVALRLTAGQALRFAISGTSSPRYEPNPNVATPLAQHPATVATTLTLHRDDAHASEVVLPVTAGTFPGARTQRPDLDAGLEPRADAGTGADAGARADGGKPIARDAATRDASLTEDEERSPPGSEGCACSTHDARVDAGPLLLLALSWLLSIRARAGSGSGRARDRAAPAWPSSPQATGSRRSHRRCGTAASA